MHAPPEHSAVPPLAGAEHVLPHSPHDDTSSARSRHSLPQRSSPPPHVGLHIPSTQVTLPMVGAWQLLSQTPQCSASVSSSTQEAPHLVLPAGHSATHSPL